MRNEDRRATSARQTPQLFEPTLERQVSRYQRRGSGQREQAPLDAFAAGMGRGGKRALRRIDRDLHCIGSTDYGDVLHLTQHAIARTGTGQAREQRSQEKQQVQIGSLTAGGSDIMCRVAFV